jgi:predicted amidohydrolase YtcJ
VAPAHLKARETCPKPGDLHWDTLQNALKSGWRLAGVHICGSESARAFVRMVEEARQANGWSMEDVRQMRMTGEHCGVIGKNPEIMEMFKNYNMILSCGPDIVDESPDWIKDYGEQMNQYVLPFNTWIKNGVGLVGQHYGSGSSNPGRQGFRPPFFMLWQAVTRKYDGQVWQPEERIHRVHALKMYTSWAAEYVRKPEKLGSLEEGKYADLLVIDRDYFTVPEQDILKVRPLMTMVGGRMVVLQPSLARQFNTQPVGPVYGFEDHDVEHIGSSLADIAAKYGHQAQPQQGEM